MPNIYDNKYRVIQDLDVLEPGDYFVLKRGDVLAISTLRSYANNAMTMLELERAGHMVLEREQRNHLLALADYSSTLADKWEQDQTKLPD